MQFFGGYNMGIGTVSANARLKSAIVRFYFTTNAAFRVKARAALPFFAAALLVAAFAFAAEPTAFANVVGSDFQNFNPTSNGLDFVTVHSSETLAPGILNLGWFVNYAVNALPEYDENDQLIRYRSPNQRNSLVGSDLSIGLGLMNNWDLGISLPSVLSQKIEADNSRFQYKARGFNEVRANTKVRLFGSEDYGLAVVGDISQNLIENNPILGSAPGPTYTLQLAGDFTVSRIALGLNLGYRKRNPGPKIPDVPLTPFHNQVIGSAALSYLIQAIHTKAIFEVYGSRPLNADALDMRKLQNTAEALFGLKRQQSQHLDLDFGVGGALNKTAASPDYRIYAGLNYAIGPLWDKPEHTVSRSKIKKPKAAPAEKERETEETVETYVIHDIHFQYDSDHVVLAGAKAALDEVFQALRSNPSYRLISVEGHTDSIASDEYNLELSQRRAATIRRYLISVFKLPAEKVESVGYGETRPVASNDNYQGRQLNRRVEIKIYRGD